MVGRRAGTSFRRQQVAAGLYQLPIPPLSLPCLPSPSRCAETLQQVTLPYLTDAACKDLYRSGQIKPGMLCAGNLAGGQDRWGRGLGVCLHSLASMSGPPLLLLETLPG